MGHGQNASKGSTHTSLCLYTDIYIYTQIYTCNTCLYVSRLGPAPLTARYYWSLLLGGGLAQSNYYVVGIIQGLCYGATKLYTGSFDPGSKAFFRWSLKLMEKPYMVMIRNGPD